MSPPDAMAADTFRRTLLPTTVTEDDLQAFVLDYAAAHGWLTFHLPNWLYRLAIASIKRARRARRWSTEGFPDTVCLRAPRLVFIELKSARGTTTPGQRGWLDGLAAVPGVEVYLFKPQDQDRIEDVLR